ncbi:MAG: nucleoside-triphosphatase [Candidatus Brocadiia bacterium]
MNVIVTGPIGSGKTTAVRQAVRGMAPAWVGGICTYPVLRNGRKVALALASHDGQERVFARAPGGADSPADFEVDLRVFNSFGVDLLRRAAEAPLVVLDELGLLEQQARDYCDAVADLWRQHDRVVAVTQQRALAFWQDRLGPDVPHESFDLNASDRDTLPAAIRATISRARR